MSTVPRLRNPDVEGTLKAVDRLKRRTNLFFFSLQKQFSVFNELINKKASISK